MSTGVKTWVFQRFGPKFQIRYELTFRQAERARNFRRRRWQFVAKEKTTPSAGGSWLRFMWR